MLTNKLSVLCSSPKKVFISANIIYMLSGLLMLAIGIVAKVNPGFIVYMLQQKLKVLNVSEAFYLEGIITGSAIFMIIVGAAVAALGFAGCCGACFEQKPLLIAHFVVLSVILCVELVLIIIAVVGPENYKDLMQKSISKFKQDAKVENGTLEMPNDAISLAWTTLQLSVNCCGAYGYSDYANRSHNVTIDGKTRSAAVPISCCAKNNSVNLSSSGRYNTWIFRNLNSCLDGNYTYINEMNCFDSVVQVIRKWEKNVAIDIICVIIIEEILLIILAVVLCREDENNEECG